MKRKSSQAILIIIIILLILLIIGYIFVPFAGNSFLSKVYSPLCGIKKMYQGEAYLPAWCLDSKRIEQEQEEKNENINNNANVNINANTNTNANANTNINEPVNENSNTNAPVGMANPASVKCEEDGGTLEIIDSAEGQWGLCTFEDKSICEEWAYFRGECQKGKCFKKCDAIGTRSEGWYDSCTDRLIKYENCAEDVVAEPTSGNIKVESPVAGAQLSSPIELKGQSIAKDNMVYIRIKSKEGTTLITEDVKAVSKSGTEWADFSIKIEYEFTRTTEGFIEVYSLDDNDKEVSLVSIPVKF